MPYFPSFLLPMLFLSLAENQTDGRQANGTWNSIRAKAFGHPVRSVVPNIIFLSHLTVPCKSTHNEAYIHRSCSYQKAVSPVLVSTSEQSTGNRVQIVWIYTFFNVCGSLWWAYCRHLSGWMKQFALITEPYKFWYYNNIASSSTISSTS